MLYRVGAIYEINLYILTYISVQGYNRWKNIPMLHNTVHQSNNEKYFVIEDIDPNFIVISNVTDFQPWQVGTHETPRLYS